jgi:hypothetical protein
MNVKVIQSRLPRMDSRGVSLLLVEISRSSQVLAVIRGDDHERLLRVS